jgi:cytochrome bd-type quinol oxidase subunit 2
MFEQIKKDYNENRTFFWMHLAGVAGLIFEVTTFLIFHGSVSVEVPSGSPTKISLLGALVVIKLCALLFIQWIIATGQARIQTEAAKSSASLAIIVSIVVALIAAWLTVVNLHWMFFPDGFEAMRQKDKNVEIIIGFIASLVAIVIHVFVLISTFDTAAEREKVKNPTFDRNSFDNATGFGYVVYFVSLGLVVLASYAG